MRIRMYVWFLWSCRRRVVLLCTFVLLCSKSPLACTHIVKGEIHTNPHRRPRPRNGRRKTDQLVVHALLLFVCVCLHRGVSESRKLPAIGFVLGYHSAVSAGLRTVCKEKCVSLRQNARPFPTRHGRSGCMHACLEIQKSSLQTIFSQPSKSLRLRTCFRVRAFGLGRPIFARCRNTGTARIFTLHSRNQFRYQYQTTPTPPTRKIEPGEGATTAQLNPASPKTKKHAWNTHHDLRCGTQP